MTMGIVLVACLAAQGCGFRRDDNVHLEADQVGGEAWEPSGLPSAHRYSMMMFRPST